MPLVQCHDMPCLPQILVRVNSIELMWIGLSHDLSELEMTKERMVCTEHGTGGVPGHGLRDRLLPGRNANRRSAATVALGHPLRRRGHRAQLVSEVWIWRYLLLWNRATSLLLVFTCVSLACEKDCSSIRACLLWHHGSKACSVAQCDWTCCYVLFGVRIVSARMSLTEASKTTHRACVFMMQGKTTAVHGWWVAVQTLEAHGSTAASRSSSTAYGLF